MIKPQYLLGHLLISGLLSVLMIGGFLLIGHPVSPRFVLLVATFVAASDTLRLGLSCRFKRYVWLCLMTVLAAATIALLLLLLGAASQDTLFLMAALYILIRVIGLLVT